MPAIRSSRVGSRTSARPSWVATCSAADPGRGVRIHGRAFGGPTPPYHHPVFVLTHHAREPLEMDGGTTFYFVTGGIESAFEQARDAAGGKDVSLGGGASAVQQYLRPGTSTSSCSRSSRSSSEAGLVSSTISVRTCRDLSRWRSSRRPVSRTFAT